MLRTGHGSSMDFEYVPTKVMLANSAALPIILKAFAEISLPPTLYLPKCCSCSVLFAQRRRVSIEVSYSKGKESKLLQKTAATVGQRI